MLTMIRLPLVLAVIGWSVAVSHCCSAEQAADALDAVPGAQRPQKKKVVTSENHADDFPHGPLARTATPPSRITVPSGFRVELLRSAQEDEGSWISMTFDPRGRIIVGLDGVGLARLSPAEKDSHPWEFERIDNTLRHCRGVLFAHDAVYVNATDSKEFWRLRDSDGDGQFDDRKLLKRFDYRSRYGHGQNQLTLGPDGMLYLVVGNDVSFPEGVSSQSPYRDPRPDRLLPDPHDAGQDNRVGCILRTDAEGREWTVIAGGLRNQVDLAFNPDGEMFTWDADMEWDVGLPWYRPTRLNHVVSGGEYGWRWGTAKWSASYQDSLPATLETGLGSPTGLVFGTDSRFPAEYREALFMADWQHGRILATTVTPEGASYTAVDRVFAAGAPLNVCDIAFGPDGAMYFITGGRRSQSGLYRVSFVGPDDAVPAAVVHDTQAVQHAQEARTRRHRLEEFHTSTPSAAVDAVWTDVGSRDRWLRAAARVALEHQPLERWRARSIAETDPLRHATAMLAWVRVATAEERPAVLREWLRWSPPDDETVVLTHLRVASIALARGTPLSEVDRERLVRGFNKIAPERSGTVRREIAELLVAAEAPDAAARLLEWLARSQSQEDEIHFAHALVRHRGPWTISQRKQMLAWLHRARRFTGGQLVPAVLGHLREDFLATFSDVESVALAAELAALSTPPATDETPAAPLRPVVKHWSMDDLAPHLGRVEPSRNVDSARTALAAAQCLKCHRLGGSGTPIGPDLSAVGSRFDLRAIAESILEPSKVVDEKYQTTIWELASGRVVRGRVAHIGEHTIKLELNPLTGEAITIDLDDVEASHPDPVSPMPQGLLDTLTLEEILDLLASLRAGGNPQPSAPAGR